MTWLEDQLWPMLQGVCLIVGVEPFELDKKEIRAAGSDALNMLASKIPDPEKQARIKELYKHAKHAMILRRFPWYHSPSVNWFGTALVEPVMFLKWARDFGEKLPKALAAHLERQLSVPEQTPEQASSVDALAVFRREKDLEWEDLTIRLFWKKRMLRISAKDTKPVTVHMTDLGLFKRGSLEPSMQAVLLKSMVGRVLPKPVASKDGARVEKHISLLRKMLEKHLGIYGNPFKVVQQPKGWRPVFTILDGEQLAEDRDTRNAKLVPYHVADPTGDHLDAEFVGKGYVPSEEDFDDDGPERDYHDAGDENDDYLKRLERGEEIPREELERLRRKAGSRG